MTEKVLPEHKKRQKMIREVLIGLITLLAIYQAGRSIYGSIERQMFLQAMQGSYRFKPRGSVETADIRSQRSDFVNFLQVIPQLTQMWPATGTAWPRT